MAARDLFPGEYAVLAMLRLGPKHGYEMARFMERDGLSDVIRLEQSLLYANLKNLERRELVSGCEERAGAYPPRRVFHLTAAGEGAIDRWLTHPVQRLREVRLDFMPQLYFLHQIHPTAERTLLMEQIAVCQAYRDRVVAQITRTEPAGFQRLVLGSKASGAIATLAWLREYAEDVEKTNPIREVTR